MSTGEIILYQSQDGATAIDVTFEQDMIRFTQKQIAELFGEKLSNYYEVSEKHIFIWGVK